MRSRRQINDSGSFMRVHDVGDDDNDLLLLLLLLESLHDFRPVLGAESSLGDLTLPGYRVVAGWGRLAGVPLSVHPHIRTMSVHPIVVSPFLHV